MNSEKAYEILSNKLGIRLDEDTKKALLDIVKTDPKYAFHTARDVLCKRWIEGEEYIKNNPEYAYLYAREIIKDRWIEAEDIIKKSSWYSYSYAKNVIGGRWIEAEDYIGANHDSARDYAKDVVGDPDFWKKRDMLKSIENLKNTKKATVNPELENLKKQRDELDLKIRQLEPV